MQRSFRLAGLLRLRALQEDHAAGALAASHGALRTAERRRGATLATLAGHAMPVAADASAWRTSATARGALAHLLADAAIEVRDAGERVAADTALWSAARSRSAALEKLQDAHRELVRAEDDRTEQLALDEVAARSARTTPVGAAPGSGVPAGPRARTSTSTATSASTRTTTMTDEGPRA